MTIIRERRAGRAIVRTADGRVLMIRGEDPGDRARGAFWFTPGGGLDDDETEEDGTRRELREETGLSVETLGPIVLRRRDRFPLLGETWLQTEAIYLVTVDEPFEPDGTALEAVEATVISEFCWLSVAELRSLDEAVYPRCLVDLLTHIDAHGPPTEPWLEDLTDEE